jgi:formamidopyrimidine-DNA glycosylase
MPELPEVQTVVDSLNDLKLKGRRVINVRVYWPKTIAGMAPATFKRKIKGRRIRDISRRGKFIVISLSRDLTLLVHLRMTGRLNWTAADIKRNPHEHVILLFSHKMALRFQDTRKFGRFYLTSNPQEILGKLGPEPLSDRFTLERFHAMLQARKRLVKPLLLDQGFIAGLGNIYVDEALWKAGIHPLRVSSSLSKKEVAALHKAIPRVLQKGLANLGTTLGSGAGNFYSVAGRRGRNADELFVFRRTGEGCTKCRTPIERIVVGQRSTHICPHCQRM